MARYCLERDIPFPFFVFAGVESLDISILHYRRNRSLAIFLSIVIELCSLDSIPKRGESFLCVELRKIGKIGEKPAVGTYALRFLIQSIKILIGYLEKTPKKLIRLRLTDEIDNVISRFDVIPVCLKSRWYSLIICTSFLPLLEAKLLVCKLGTAKFLDCVHEEVTDTGERFKGCEVHTGIIDCLKARVIACNIKDFPQRRFLRFEPIAKLVREALSASFLILACYSVNQEGNPHRDLSKLSGIVKTSLQELIFIYWNCEGDRYMDRIDEYEDLRNLVTESIECEFGWLFS